MFNKNKGKETPAIAQIQKVLKDGLADFTLLGATKGYGDDVQVMYISKIIKKLEAFRQVV